ncbi:helix-turn-helix domain-containing protein [Streptomyces sp. NPDC089424]|uniref:helix-turn-helix domain-containing protein n=1 Tax=Streptomyces sp. NPDC089424 TaxID=3365917 RepID=UPI0038270794
MSEGTAAGEFAELLRGLKDRSGLSYGVLAKRLHVSTSTLHRYCNGEAVPADYAPVERLARVCKASPEELVELHRRWVLADARRGRQGSGVAGAVAPEAPDEDGAEVRDRGAGGVTRRPRRRAVLLGAAAVAAVLGAVVLAVTVSSGGGSGDGGRPGPVGAAAPHDVSEPPARSSPTTSASASASASPDAEPAAPTSPAPGSSGPSTGAQEADAEPPLNVTVRPYTWEDPCSQHYLIDRPAGEVGPPPVEQDAPAWVSAYGAVSAGEQLVTLTVQGSGARTVVLDGMKVRVVGKDTPLAWNDYTMGVGCGGDVPTRPFTVALDGARPEVVAGAGQRDFPLKVSESDPEVLRVTADASAYDVRWYLELTWTSGDRHGTLVVDDGGRPFRTSGNNGRPGFQFPPGAEKWDPAVTG